MVDLFPKARPGMVVPPSLTKVLLPHQIQGITFLWNCLTKTDTKEDDSHGNGRGAILADQMGLGKSLMTVCVLFALHRRSPMHRFVVVCPSSLTTNWSNEFDKWIGKASQPKRVVVNKGGEHGLAKMRAFVPVKPHLSEVLIISYDLFRRNASLLTQAKQIGLLVLDEGHKLKNSAGSHTLTALQQLNTEARLLLTGTPIQNNLTEFYTVANFVCPGRLGNVASFRRDYERPIAAANSKAASVQQRRRGREQSKALDAITKTFMIRRLQKNLLKSTLPPRHEFLLFCRPSDVQCDLYRSLASRNTVGGMGPTAEALTVLTNLRKLCCHPSLVQEDGRGPLTSNDIASSGKLEILLALLEATKLYAPNDKVVIVSNFTSALSVMEETILKPRNWPYHRLDGSTVQADRQSAVDSFNRASAEKTFVFLLSSKAGGCGLNMVGANRLIMFDADFNPATDSQAMARIYRKGQTKSCFIYRLFSAGTIEEVVLQRQMHKGNLASATVDGSSSTKVNSRGFSKEELRDCFTLKENAACDTQRKLGKKWAAYGGPTDSHLVAIGDSPLVFVAESRSDKLTFVHVVEEQENSVNSSDDDDEDMDEFDLDDRSSSEEHEFEDEQSNSSTGSVGDDTSEEQEFNG